MSEGIKGLIGKKIKKPVKFMGGDVNIIKLSVSQVMEIQEQSRQADSDSDGLSMLKKVIRMSVEGASDLTDNDFDTFAMDELTKLSGEILKFSGLGADAGK